MWSAFLTEFDVLLGPVSTDPVPAVGFDLGGPGHADALWHAHRLLVAVNLLGLPALAAPAGLDDEGLPMGVQLIASRYRESACLEAGQLIEEALGSVTPIDPRRPPLPRPIRDGAETMERRGTPSS